MGNANHFPAAWETAQRKLIKEAVLWRDTTPGEPRRPRALIQHLLDVELALDGGTTIRVFARTTLLRRRRVESVVSVALVASHFIEANGWPAFKARMATPSPEYPTS